VLPGGHRDRDLNRAGVFGPLIALLRFPIDSALQADELL
jgi:hypothetical protein